MIVLSIDTAFSACQVAVIDTENTQRTHARTMATDREQAELLIPMICDVIQEAGISFENINLIVVDIGPGSFTGLRVGIATARGLVLALNCPIQGVMSMDALYSTWRTRNPDQPNVHVLIDTLRGDYYGLDYFDPHYLPRQVSDISILTEENRSSLSPTIPIIGTVPGTLLSWPDPVVLARTGYEYFKNNSNHDQGYVDPVYIRPAEVSISKKNGRILLDPLLIKDSFL